MNIWRLSKEPALRVALLRLSAEHGLQGLTLQDDACRQSVRLCDPRRPGLTAYIYTYGQPQQRYGLQLRFPAEREEDRPVYPALEEIRLDKLMALLNEHFELS